MKRFEVHGPSGIGIRNASSGPTACQALFLGRQAARMGSFAGGAGGEALYLETISSFV